MNISEQALSFVCAGEQLVGIVCVPDEARSTGVIILVGGPQYRAGSHRQFLLLSRILATAGYPVMRFDFRGMGDSGGEPGGFENVEDDIAAAIDAFMARYTNVMRVVLWGLCDAASASLLYWDARRDQRIAGLCLLNPWVRSEVSLAKTHLKHYYGQRLLQGDFWKKLLTGKTGVVKAISGLVLNWRMTRQVVGTQEQATKNEVFQSRMARALKNFNGPIMLILSGNDYTAKEFLQYTADDPLWHAGLNKPSLACLTLPDADHTFSSAAWRADVAKTTQDWLMEVDLAAKQKRVGAARAGSDCR